MFGRGVSYEYVPGTWYNVPLIYTCLVGVSYVRVLHCCRRARHV